MRFESRKLAKQGLAEPHHRGLIFIARQPDLTVGELLKLLAITKQSLGRVLKEIARIGLHPDIARRPSRPAPEIAAA